MPCFNQPGFDEYIKLFCGNFSLALYWFNKDHQ